MQSADSNNILRHSVSDPPSAIPWDYGFSQVWCVPLLLRLPAYADPSCGNLRSRTSEMDEAVGKAGHCACQVLQSLHDNAHSGSDPHPSQNRYLHIWDWYKGGISMKPIVERFSAMSGLIHNPPGKPKLFRPPPMNLSLADACR